MLKHALPCAPGPIALVGEPESWEEAVRAELAAPVVAFARPADEGGVSSSGRMPTTRRHADPSRTVCDRRGAGIAGVLTTLIASGEPVLVVCADTRRRLEHLSGRLGGFALCSWTALERSPPLVGDAYHVVLLDPPAHPALRALATAGRPAQLTHLCWGAAELGFAQHVHDEQHALRDHISTAYRLLRGAPADVAGALPRSPVAAGRVLRVLCELGLVELDRVALTVAVPAFAGRTALERSPTFAACTTRHREGNQWLRPAEPRAA